MSFAFSCIQTDVLVSEEHAECTLSPRMKIKEHYDVLMRSFDPSVEFLSRIQLQDHNGQLAHCLSDIASLKTRHEKIASLLGLLNGADMATSNTRILDAFLRALRETGQAHVANIFTAESEELPMSTEHHGILKENLYQLSKCVDPENGLLEVLVSAGVLNDGESERIRSKGIVRDVAMELLTTVMRKSDGSFDKFVSALRSTKQDHAALLREDGSGRTAKTGNDENMKPEMPPMPNERRDVLSRKLNRLWECLDPGSGILDALVSESVLNAEDKERIEMKITNSSMVSELVAILKRKSDRAFDAFIAALRATSQEHVVSMLTDGKQDGFCVPIERECVRMIDRQRRAIAKNMEPTVSTLVNELVSKGVFRSRDKERVDQRQANDNGKE